MRRRSREQHHRGRALVAELGITHASCASPAIPTSRISPRRRRMRIRRRVFLSARRDRSAAARPRTNSGLNTRIDYALAAAPRAARQSTLTVVVRLRPGRGQHREGPPDVGAGEGPHENELLAAVPHVRFPARLRSSRSSAGRRGRRLPVALCGVFLALSRAEAAGAEPRDDDQNVGRSVCWRRRAGLAKQAGERAWTAGL